MSMFQPNKSTVGEVCEQLARLTMPEARAALAELKRMGIQPVPIISYQRDDDFQAFMGQLDGGVTPVLFDNNFNNTGAGTGPSPGSIIEVKRIWIWTPGQKTAAGVVTLTLASLSAAGDLAGTTLSTQRRRDFGPDSAFFPNGMTKNGAATATKLNLWQGQLWVPAAPVAGAPIVFDLTNAGTVEGPQIAAGASPTVIATQGISLVASGTVLGLQGIQGAIEWIERPSLQ